MMYLHYILYIYTYTRWHQNDIIYGQKRKHFLFGCARNRHAIALFSYEQLRLIIGAHIKFGYHTERR